MLAGDANRAAGRHDIARLPENVVLPGYLTGADLDSAIASADAILALTKLDDAQLSSAGEAIGAGRPMVLSDTPVTRDLYYQGGVFVDTYSPASILKGCRAAIEGGARLAAESLALRDERYARWRSQAESIHEVLAICSDGNRLERPLECRGLLGSEGSSCILPVFCRETRSCVSRAARGVALPRQLASNYTRTDKCFFGRLHGGTQRRTARCRRITSSDCANAGYPVSVGRSGQVCSAFCQHSQEPTFPFVCSNTLTHDAREHHHCREAHLRADPEVLGTDRRLFGGEHSHRNHPNKGDGGIAWARRSRIARPLRIDRRSCRKRRRDGCQ